MLHVKNEWKNKKVLKGKAKNKYRELSEEEKNIKREYGRNIYHNMSEAKKQKRKEYQNKLSWFKKKSKTKS